MKDRITRCHGISSNADARDLGVSDNGGAYSGRGAPAYSIWAARGAYTRGSAASSRGPDGILQGLKVAVVHLSGLLSIPPAQVATDKGVCLVSLDMNFKHKTGAPLQQEADGSKEAVSSPARFGQGEGNALLAEHLDHTVQIDDTRGLLEQALDTEDDKREVYLRHAQGVVTESNARAAEGADPVWLANNGMNQGVHPDGGVKPKEWNRGIRVDNNQFQSQSNGDSVKATGIDTLDKLREQIENDLNFNNVFERYTDEKAFVSALVSYFGEGGQERAAEIEAIAENLWAYGTTGADVEGRTDVGELQGLLFSLDPMIAEVSQSNTEHDGSFTIPGSQIGLATHGDDDYGRASMLECRLLASILAEADSDRDLVGFDESYLLLDRSASMKVFEYGKIAELLDVAAIDGVVGLAGYDNGPDSLGQFEKGAPMERTRAQEILQIVSDHAASRPYSEIYQRLKDVGLNGKLPYELIESTGSNEMGLACALKWAERLPPKQEGVERQLVVVTDEPDYHPRSLKDLQDVAEEKGLSVKVLFSYDARGYVIVDVMDIDVDKMTELYSDDPRRHGQLDWDKAGKAQQAPIQPW